MRERPHSAWYGLDGVMDNEESCESLGRVTGGSRMMYCGN